MVAFIIFGSTIPIKSFLPKGEGGHAPTKGIQESKGGNL
jgi:hypothetical protein